MIIPGINCLKRGPLWLYLYQLLQAWSSLVDYLCVGRIMYRRDKRRRYDAIYHSSSKRKFKLLRCESLQQLHRMLYSFRLFELLYYSIYREICQQ